MKKGISMWAFTDRSPEVCFQLAQKYGFDGVEVALGENGPVKFDSTQDDIKQYRKVAESYGMSLYSLVCDLCWAYSLTSNSTDICNKAEEMVITQLKIASWLGCDTILVLPGMVQGLSSEDEIVSYDVVYNRSLEALKRLSKYAEEFGVTIGLENVWNKFLLSPLEMRDFIDKIGSSRVQSYFDVGNVVVNGFPEQWIKILSNRIAKIHFKDYIRSNGTLDGFVNILEGDVDYKAVMKALDEIGYNGWVTAEVFPINVSTEEALKINSLAMDQILRR